MTNGATSIEGQLLESGQITQEILEKARERQRDGKSLGEVLLEMGAVDARTWAQALAHHYGLPFAETLPQDDVISELIKHLPINYAKRCQLLPIARNNGHVVVATADPGNVGAMDDLRLLLHQPVRALVAPAPVIIDAINRVYDLMSGSASEMMDDLDQERLDLIAVDLDEPRDLLEADDEAPIIRLVNSLLFQAAKDRASDIHIEPFERELTVRFRIDGILYDVISPPKRFQPIIISRVKIMAGLNIAEKRLPQDGRIRIRLAGKDVDIRVSTVPTSYGERVVMRLLDKNTTVLHLEQLGLVGAKHELVNKLIKQSHGIILVTGPTGSGKTTTLYACLSKINTVDKNIITIEDPVEYQLNGIGQIQVNPKIELTFANGLRSILRQDPDVIMVGEIRDSVTAEIAIQAALTGHLVFSTLHTNDSFGAMTRLLDMGVEPFLVSSSVIAVMAQRLVRRVCPSCREPYQPTREEIEELGLPAHEIMGHTIYKAGPGCDDCKRTGYKGRSGIHELLVVDDEIRNLVMKSADASAIRRAATAQGMNTLRGDGAEKVLQGITSIEEILRVTREDLI